MSFRIATVGNLLKMPPVIRSYPGTLFDLIWCLIVDLTSLSVVLAILAVLRQELTIGKV